MKVAVKLFASYRELAGASQTSVVLEEGSSVDDLLRELAARFPALPDCERIVVAVNNEYQPHDFRLADGDEAALIPPVSGG